MGRSAGRLRVVLRVFGQVGDLIPPLLWFGAVRVGRGRPLQSNVRQMRIVNADIVFELGMKGVAAQGDIRERPTVVSRPTHASHLAMATVRTFHSPFAGRSVSPILDVLLEVRWPQPGTRWIAMSSFRRTLTPGRIFTTTNPICRHVSTMSSMRGPRRTPARSTI